MWANDKILDISYNLIYTLNSNIIKKKGYNVVILLMCKVLAIEKKSMCRPAMFLCETQLLDTLTCSVHIEQHVNLHIIK